MSLDVTRGCPPEIELSRAISLGETAALSGHLGACARCAALIRTLALPRELARELPWRHPSDAAREQMRTALLSSFAREAPRAPRARVWRLAWLALPALAATVALVVSHLSVLSRAPVAPAAERAVVSPTPAPAPPVVPSIVEPPRDPRPVPSRTSLRTKVAGERYVSPAAPTPAEAAFLEGWSAFRAGRYAVAIDALADSSRLDPSGPLAEDARYWRAVALARTNAASAIDELQKFVSRYPRSAHVAEASVLLGDRLLAVGRRHEAARAFGAALDANDPEISARARAGLDATSAQ
jgi:tetratricopeptide (TPR) repeat protein